MKKATPKAKAPSAEQLLDITRRVTDAQNELPGGFETACTLRHNAKAFGVTDLVYAGDLIQAKANYAFLQQLCFNLSRFAGWHNHGIDDNSFGTKIALIHSEVSEALEGFRKGKMDDHLPHRKSVEVELADAVIRIMDLSGALELDVAGAIIEKLAYNQRREDHKAENRAAVGGKRF